jgi:hypothetical protein
MNNLKWYYSQQIRLIESSSSEEECREKAEQLEDVIGSDMIQR